MINLLIVFISTFSDVFCSIRFLQLSTFFVDHQIIFFDTITYIYFIWLHHNAPLIHKGQYQFLSPSDVVLHNFLHSLASTFCSCLYLSIPHLKSFFFHHGTQQCLLNNKLFSFCHTLPHSYLLTKTSVLLLFI